MPEPRAQKKPVQGLKTLSGSERPQDEEEILQFLKREEVRTMAKDVALLREEEAKKERERIAKIKTEEPQPTPPSLMPHTPEQKPVFIKARTRFEKVFIRAIVVGVLLFILLNGLAFGYWYFTRKNVAEIAPSPQPSTSAEATADTSPDATAGEAEPTPQPSPTPTPSPLVFFETLQEKTIDLDATDTLLLLLSDALKEGYPEGYPQGFTRILVKKEEGGAFLNIREFLEKTAVAAPEPLLSVLEEDFMLFVYSSPGRKRLGFIAEVSRVEGVEDIVRQWETTLEQDTKALWEIIGQKGSAYTPFFRQSVYQNSLVRFQTFSVVDFGIVYTLFGTKLVLSTSFESVTQAVDQILQSRP